MKSIASTALMLSAAALVSASAHATSTLVGDTIDASMNFTAASDFGAHRITGFGLDHPFVVTSDTADLKNFAQIFTLAVSGNSFTVDFLRAGQFLNGVELKLTGLDFSSGASLQSVAINSNLSGYSVSQSAHEIDINFSNVYFNANSAMTGTFGLGAIAPVPEPSTSALAAFGIGMVCLLAARRRAGRERSRAL